MNPKDLIRKEITYKSTSAGVVDWKYPEDKDLNWENHFTGIITNAKGYEFNFVFKDGTTSNAPISG